MTTGNFENWHGNMLDIGPLYPFVGLEWLFTIIALACWVGWHFLQMRQESAIYAEEMEKLKQVDHMMTAIKTGHM